MTRARLERGKSAEDLAASWLEARGHRVLARNVRFRVGEIDLITRQGDTTVSSRSEAAAETALGHPSSRSTGGSAESSAG